MKDPKHVELYNKVTEMQKAVTCLALELPEPVYDDVARRWTELKLEVQLICPENLWER